MKRNLLIRITKYLVDFMFFAGIIICAGVPYLFREAGKIFSIFKTYYIPFCIIFMVAGFFAILILWNLKVMMRTVIHEDPFIRENVTSLKRMGICAFIISALMSVRLFFIVTPADLVLILVFLIAGLFSMVLSHVFDQAVSYKQENDLTI